MPNVCVQVLNCQGTDSPWAFCRASKILLFVTLTFDQEIPKSQYKYSFKHVFLTTQTNSTPNNHTLFVRHQSKFRKQEHSKLF